MEFVEDIGVRLKESIDINELKDPTGHGAEFEVDEEDLNTGDTEECTINTDAYEKNLVASNICWLSDNEDENEENTDGEYLTDVERLQARMDQVGVDITPTKDKGVLKQIKSHGVGPVIPPGSLVSFHYNAYSDVGQAPMDSSRLRDRPFSVRLGTGGCLEGLELGLLTMKKKEFVRFLIRHDYAYGEMGCRPRIPAKATIICDVEVLYFVEQDGVSDYYNMSLEERKSKLTYTDIEKVAKAALKEGREFFERISYNQASKRYNQAIHILETYQLKNDEEERLCNEQLVRCNVNAAICDFKMQHYGRCISHSNQALQFNKKSVKALYFKGKSLHALGSFEDAKDCLCKARSLKPMDTVISKALQNLVKSMSDHDVWYKGLCRKMMSQTVSSEEANSSNKEEQKKEMSPGNVTDEFRTLVEQRLKAFKEDSDLTELPFSQILSPDEMYCILDVAERLGLNVRQRGTGSNVRIELYKRV